MKRTVWTELKFAFILVLISLSLNGKLAIARTPKQCYYAGYEYCLDKFGECTHSSLNCEEPDIQKRECFFDDFQNTDFGFPKLFIAFLILFGLIFITIIVRGIINCYLQVQYIKKLNGQNYTYDDHGNSSSILPMQSLTGIPPPQIPPEQINNIQIPDVPQGNNNAEMDGLPIIVHQIQEMILTGHSPFDQGGIASFGHSNPCDQPGIGMDSNF